MTTQPKPPAPAANRRQTWRALVRDVLRRAGTSLPLQAIYDALRETPKAKANPTFKATIRRTLQQDPTVERVGKGVWRLKPKS